MNDPTHGGGESGASNRNVVIIGAGITGLTAAHRLSTKVSDLCITVLEASDRAGGKLRTSSIDDPALAGVFVDEGADAFLRRVPHALDLCKELGIDEELVSPASSSASLWLNGSLVPIPTPNALGVPLDPATVDRRLLDKKALARLAGDGHPDPGSRGFTVVNKEALSDLSIGAVVRACAGDQVFERIVDPLLGGINAGQPDESSCAVMAPQLLSAARAGGGMLATLRAVAAESNSTTQIFATPTSGMEQLIKALVEKFPTGPGARSRQQLVVNSPAMGLARDNRGWLVVTPTKTYQADAVILAVPAHSAAGLVGPLAPEASETLASWRHASVVLTTFAYNRNTTDVHPDQSGFLVGRNEGLLMTACSFSGSKWAHLNHPERTVLRVSCGRMDDDRPTKMNDKDLVGLLKADLATTLDIKTPPTAVRISRWPQSLVQFPVGHIDRMARVDAALDSECPGLLVAGAVRYGVGIPACVRSGNEAAEAVAHLLS